MRWSNLVLVDSSAADLDCMPPVFSENCLMRPSRLSAHLASFKVSDHRASIDFEFKRTITMCADSC